MVGGNPTPRGYTCCHLVASPCKEMQDSLEFLIPRCGSRHSEKLDSRYQSFSWYLMLYSRVLRQDSRFHKKNFLDSGFQRQNFSRLQNPDSLTWNNYNSDLFNMQQLLDEAPGYSTKIYTGRLCPEVQPLTLLYTIFHKKGAPFIFSVDKWYPLHIPC